MARLGNDPFIHPDCEIHEASFGRFVEIGKGSRITNSVIGDYSYCDRYADIANADVGKFANVAAFTRIGATDHPMHTASMHHFLYRSGDYWDDAGRDEGFFEHRASRRATIGHDTWIGNGAMIKPELTVGIGAVVASGAVVTKDVAPFTIVAGMPAVKIRDRHTPAIIERLMALAWWDWDHDQLRASLDDFRKLPVAEFLGKYGG